MAVKEGKRLFHGEVYLPRATYQKYAKEGKIDVGSLKLEISRFLKDKNEIPNIDLQKWLENLVFQISHPISGKNELADTSDIHAALHKTEAERPLKSLMQSVSETLKNNLLKDKPVYEATDILFGARVGDELDKLVIDSCLDFFDEGQSVWSMPERQLGFFHAWKDVASRNLPFFFRGVRIGKILEESETPEGKYAEEERNSEYRFRFRPGLDQDESISKEEEKNVAAELSCRWGTVVECGPLVIV